nr:hypothetical protein [Tanacetum cinerariifolium]
ATTGHPAATTSPDPTPPPRRTPSLLPSTSPPHPMAITPSPSPAACCHHVNAITNIIVPRHPPSHCLTIRVCWVVQYHPHGALDLQQHQRGIPDNLPIAIPRPTRDG